MTFMRVHHVVVVFDNGADIREEKRKTINIAVARRHMSNNHPTFVYQFTLQFVGVIGFCYCVTFAVRLTLLEFGISARPLLAADCT